MIRDIQREYYEWLCDLATGMRHIRQRYHVLLKLLHDTEFIWDFPLDENRAADGVDLRWEFAAEHDIPDDAIDATIGREPCSVLEMMVGLANRCENQIMENDAFGSRVSYWFEIMLRSSGLYLETNVGFRDKRYQNTITNLLTRNYDPDGRGGWFYVPGFDRDMRETEIWYQMHAYLETVEE